MKHFAVLILLFAMSSTASARDLSSELLGDVIYSMSRTLNCKEVTDAISSAGGVQSDREIAIALGFLAFVGGAEAATGEKQSIKILTYCVENPDAAMVNYARQ
jgi:hypothetical protein